MDAERWQLVERLYYAVLECDENQRAAFLTRVCGGDESLRVEVESLLSYGSRSGKFMEGSALELVAPALVRDGGDKQAPASAESRMIGKRISQYRVVEQLGRGGMGEVYRAVRADDQYQKQVAIKLVPAGADSSLVIGRFKNERQVLASLDHPNIARLLDAGATEEGVPYFVMELVEGQPIDKYSDFHKLGIRARLELFQQVCSALKYSHQHQIIHRDIKPANILVNEEGEPKLLDFGIAKILDSGAFASGEVRQTRTMFRAFTPEYASPEQIKAEAVTTASDVYSSGVLLYELLTGHRPYQFKTCTPSEIEQAVCEDEPLKPSAIVIRVEEQALADHTTVSITPEEISSARNMDPQQIRACLQGDLDAIVMMALRKEPYRRYASVDDLSQDIRKHLEGLPIAARPSTLLYRGAKFIGRHKELAVGVVVFLALLGSLTIIRRLGNSRTTGAQGDVVSRQLTATGPGHHVSWATISRDGKYLAYSDTASKMYLLQIDSGDLRQLPFSGFDPLDWFPDGSHLLVAGRGGLWKLSTSDGTSRKLVDGDALGKLSPDGLKIAYRTASSGPEIWVMEADGQAPHRIARFDSIESVDSLAWSPGGQRLVYARSRGEYIKPEVIIETCDLQGGQRSEVLSEPRLWGPNGVSKVYWLPDGRILYQISASGRSNYSADYSVWAIATNPWSGKPLGSPVRLTTGGNAYDSDLFQASADGKRLIYRYMRSDNAIYLGNLELGAGKFNQRRLTLEEWDNWLFDWTRDSKAVLFHSIRGSRYIILQQGIDQQTSEILVSGAENYRRPVLSPAGDRLLYTASPTVDRLDPSQRLMSKPLEGGDPIVLLAGNYVYRCGSVPTARCVLAEVRGHQLIFFNLDPVKGIGMEIQRIEILHNPNADWSLSPDGNKIAIVEQETNKGEVRILTLADHRVTTFALQGWNRDWSMQRVAWSADGNHLFGTASTETSFVLCSIDPRGKMQVLAEVLMGEAWLYDPAASPDGHYLAYMKRTHESNVVMLEHF